MAAPASNKRLQSMELLGEADLLSLMKVLQSSPELHAKWRNVGQELGLSQEMLNSVEEDNPSMNLERRFSDMLKLWLQNKYSVISHGLPSRKKLEVAIEASCGGGNVELAKKIARVSVYREELALQEEFDKIMGSVIAKVKNKDITAEQLTRYFCQILPSNVSYLADEFKDATSLKDFFSILNRIVSFRTYTLLQNFVFKFADDDVKTEMEAYSQRLNQYMDSTTCQEFAQEMDDSFLAFQPAIDLLPEEEIECHLLEEVWAEKSLKTFTRFMAENLNCIEEIIPIQSGRKGSIELIQSTTRKSATYLISEAQARKSHFIAEGFCYLKIAGNVIFSKTCTDEVPVSPHMSPNTPTKKAFYEEPLLQTLEPATLRLKKSGQTLLHLKCKNGQRKEVELILSSALHHEMLDEVLWQMDDKGRTPLHFACSNKHLDVVQALLQTRVDKHGQKKAICIPFKASQKISLLHSTFIEELSPKCYEIAMELMNHSVGNPIRIFKDFQKHFSLKIPKISLEHTIPIFVVGDARSGKSSLIRGLLVDRIEDRVEYIGKQFSVAGHKIGIIPWIVQKSSWLGNVVLFELCGGRDLHTSLPTLGNIGGALFIIVVNTKHNKTEKIYNQIHYWLQFIKRSVEKPEVVIVGSHADTLKGIVPPKEKITKGKTYAIKMFPNIKLYTWIGMDCSRAIIELIELQWYLYSRIQRINYTSPLPSICYILYWVFKEICKNPALKIKEMLQINHQIRSLWLYSAEHLMQYYQMLHNHHLIILLQDKEKADESWILNPQIIKDVSDVLSSIKNSNHLWKDNPDDAKLFSLGFVSLLNLFKVLENDKRCSSYNRDVLNQVLQLFNFFPAPHVIVSGSSPHAYLPHVLQGEKKIDRMKHKLKSASRGYIFMWVLVPAKNEDLFLASESESVLTRLSLEYIQYNPKRTVQSLSWTSSDGSVEVSIFSQNSKGLILYMRCQTGGEASCLRLRGQIMNTMRKTLHEIKCRFNEKFVFTSPKSFSLLRVDDMTMDLSAIENAVKDGKSTIIGSHPTQVSLQHLLYFEPYALLQTSILHQFFSHAHFAVHEHVFKILTAKKEHHNLMLNLLQNEDPIDSAKQIPQETVFRKITYKRLREIFDSISIVPLSKIISKKVSCTLCSFRPLIFKCSDKGIQEKEYLGASILIPEGSLELGQEAEVTIQPVLLSENEIILPKEFRIISGIYSVTTTRHFLKKVMLRIKHCAVITTKTSQMTDIHFVRSASTSSPYKFELIDPSLTDFTSDTDYGAVSLKEFSFFAIVLRKFINQLQSMITTTYSMNVFYKATATSWEVISVLVNNVEPLNRHVAEKYKDMTRYSGSPFRITEWNGPDLCVCGQISSPGWRFTDTCTPSKTIKKSEVEMTRGAEAAFPYIKLTIDRVLAPPATNTCDLTLSINRDHWEETIRLEHAPSTKDSSQPDGPVEAPPNDTPSLPLLMNFPGIGDIVEKIAPHYKRFGIIILNDGNGSIVDLIEANHPMNAYNITLAILRKWISGTGAPVTWQSLAINLKKIRDCANLASIIEERHP